MKISLNRSLAIAATCIVCLMPGCSKVYDYIHQHPGDDSKICKILKLKFPGGPGDVNVSYNAAGDPTSMVLEVPWFPGQANWVDRYFRYDKQHRLSDYLLAYHGSPGPVVWHHYTYPSGKKVVDSMFAYAGLLTDPEPPRSNFNQLITYNLDAAGRIIKRTYGNSAPTDPGTVTDFVYDSKGNLVRPGISYDKKINIYRTSKVWMFFNVDYSTNNPLPAPLKITAYNEFDLPLVFKDNPSYNNYLFDYGFNELQVVYACDAGNANY
jgi:hypothetical protein